MLIRVLAISIWVGERALPRRHKNLFVIRPLSVLLLTHQRRFVTKSSCLPADHRLSNTLFNHRPQSRLFMMNNLSQRVPRPKGFVCMVDWRGARKIPFQGEGER